MNPLAGWAPPPPPKDDTKVDPHLTAALHREAAMKTRIEKQAKLIISLHEALRYLLNEANSEAPINGGPSAIVRASEALALHEELRGGT